MITKINQLKQQTQNVEVQALCESTLSALSSAIYNNVSNDARFEIERVALTNLFEGLEKYSTDKVITEWLNNQKRVYSVKNLGVRKAINTLYDKEARFDGTLEAILDSFREKIDVVPEVLLYEDFISALSGFSHLPTANTELEAISNKVKNYKNDVDISKIIEVMKETRSNYLLPYIEDLVDNYLNDKTEQNKHFLKEALVKFSHDNFIRDILNVLMLDATQLQLEYANSECEIEDKIFSPILYLGESEVLFNVKGTYYVKKTNYINKVKKQEVENIEESFKSLCEVINYPNIEINKKDIKVYVGEDNAILTEDDTLINGENFRTDQINEAAEVAKWGGNSEFFNIVNLLRENFNEIVELDFVKRVYLKENENYAADVFKLRDHIYITTFDPLNNKSTFYRNINPIQAEKIMMEHMRFDVSKTFEDILPNKEKILSEIEDTKHEYTDYINELQTKINKFSFDYNNQISMTVVEALTEELEEVKNDYKNYLNKVEEYTSVAENLNITVQDDQSGKSYTVVVPTGAMAAKGEQGNGEVGAESTEAGTEVGMASMPSPGGSGGAASAVTFNDDESELISDQPSDERDKVDLGADELEAYADVVDAESDLDAPEGEEETGVEGGTEGGETVGGGAGDVPTAETPTEEPTEGGDELDLGNTGEEGTAEIETPEESAEDETPKEKEEEAAGPPEKNLERTNFNKDKNPNDLEEPRKPKKVFLKRQKKV